MWYTKPAMKKIIIGTLVVAVIGVGAFVAWRMKHPSFVPPKEETAEVPAGKTVEKTLAEPGTKAPDKAPDKAPEKPAAKSSGKF